MRGLRVSPGRQWGSKVTLCVPSLVHGELRVGVAGGWVATLINTVAVVSS